MKNYNFKPEEFREELLTIITEIAEHEAIDDKKLTRILKDHPKEGKGLFARDELVQGYYYLTEKGDLRADKAVLAKLKLKPTRSISGVLPVTVLTKPFPCPGKCIFCPNDVRMPKSYLSDEPGAQRAERNSFDPYLQTYNRLLALKNTGHEAAKIELIILGGTWSFYPEAYQIWFIKRCFDALNDFGHVDNRAGVKTENVFARPDKSKPVYTDTGRRRSYNELVSEVARNSVKQHATKFPDVEHASWDDLEKAQLLNESALARCVGLVIETRPDHISEEEVIRVRRLGATKTQIGFQSLQDGVLDQNKRGHDVAASARAVKLLRSAGFKIHAHWMPNLYGSDVEADKQDFLKLFSEEFHPDELKIYPCSLIETAELMDYYRAGLWRPYTEAELLDVLTFSLLHTPRQVRLTRVIRDIPSTDIVVGNKKTNFREIAEKEARKHAGKIKEIRSREIKSKLVSLGELELRETIFAADTIYGRGKEIFLEYVTDSDDICGFLRLSLPIISESHFIEELHGAAIIREVHVYGVSRDFGEQHLDTAQHLGLGKKLIARAREIAQAAGYQKISVISAIGTREYYRNRGFTDGRLYQHQDLLTGSNN